MGLSVVRKYIKIYRALIKFSLADIREYSANAIIGIIVDFGWNLTLIIFFWVIYGNINEIGGWTFPEIIFLNGAIIFIAHLNLSFSYVFSLYRLPRKIIKGEIDHTLVKPVNSQFMLTIGMPYLAGLIGLITAIYLMWWGVVNGGFQLDWANWLQGSVLLIGGLLVQYSINTIVHSLAFVVDNKTALSEVSNSIMSYRNNPDAVYKGALYKVFLFIIPVILMGSVPTRAFLHGFSWFEFFTYVLVAIVLFTFTKVFWDHMIRYYASASS